jgi:hypothetical protein
MASTADWRCFSDGSTRLDDASELAEAGLRLSRTGGAGSVEPGRPTRRMTTAPDWVEAG